MGKGRPLDETMRRHMEQRFGCDLGDVRIHDSRQAAELARRLGAEAFTIGSHIFAPPDRLNELTPEASGLLAHELTHVIQQTAPNYSGQSQEQLTRPGYHAAENPREENGQTGNVPRPRQSLALHAGSRAWQGVPKQGAGRISLEAPALSVQRTTEIEAQANEHLMRSEMEGNGTARIENGSQAAQVDREHLAYKVYQLMLQDIRLERERGVAGR